jgi:glycosyltransferase involved in cell wall biosynthesis
MSENFAISVIVPFYNAEPYLEKCIDVLLKQDFNKPFEIIMVDDASTDNGKKFIKSLNLSFLTMSSLPSNSGPSAARNEGLKISKGEYVFFLDADDTISTDTLKTLYNHIKADDFDFVCCDKGWIEDSKNQRENIYVYPADKTFSNDEITEEIKKRVYDPLYMEGLIGFQGKLIKRSIFSRNKIFFNERLRFLEDETISWDILAHCKKVKYIRQQFYSYHVNPNVSSAVSSGFSKGFSVLNFKLVKNHIQSCFENRGLSNKESEKIADHAFISLIIGTLISYSRSIILGKCAFENGKNYRKKLIADIIKDKDISKSIQNYSPSKNESPWIPRAISWKSNKLLEFACKKRAKEILNIRKKVRLGVI